MNPNIMAVVDGVPVGVRKLAPTVMPIYLGILMDENLLGAGSIVIFTATYDDS